MSTSSFSTWRLSPKASARYLRGVSASPRPTHPLALGPVTAPSSSTDAFVEHFLHHLNFDRGVALSNSSANDQYLAVAHTVRDALMARWLEDLRRQKETQAKGVCYLSR